MMIRLVSIILFCSILLLGACQGGTAEITETPPIVSATEPEVVENLPPETIASSTPFPTAKVVSPTPTVEPTATTTISPSATPTETPIPASAVQSLSLQPIIEGAFTQPLFLTHANDSRLFVVEQAGKVRIIKDGNLLESSFLDIRDRVGAYSLEQGLLSIAFHPNFPEDNRFFAFYTDLQGNTQISSFLVDRGNPDAADPTSETILLSVNQPYPNHNGGQLQFGPDGYLYAGFGDGGSANDPLNNGQNPETLLGTILRLDIDSSPDAYSVPASNPFVNDEGRRNEIWAWGLRNPWRFSFDRLKGDLFVADVGQNLWEEVNFQASDSTGGENYGWNIFEGSHCFSGAGCDPAGLEMPIFEYNHQGHCSITGGYMYRGLKFLPLYGNYFVSDYCSGTVWSLFPNGDGTWTANAVLDSEFVVSSFGEDVDGELYLIDHQGGSVYQLQP